MVRVRILGWVVAGMLVLAGAASVYAYHEGQKVGAAETRTAMNEELDKLRAKLKQARAKARLEVAKVEAKVRNERREWDAKINKLREQNAKARAQLDMVLEPEVVELGWPTGDGDGLRNGTQGNGVQRGPDAGAGPGVSPAAHRGGNG